MKTNRFGQAICLFIFLKLVTNAQVSQYTGNATYTLPLPSIGGISPSLMYTSNVRELVYANNKNDQSGWVGLGWSLEIGGIIGLINNTKDTTDDRYFYLGNDGVSELVTVSGNEFRLKNYQYWKIYRKVNGSGAILGWTIIKGDGTIHRYGCIDTAQHTFVVPDTITRATRVSLGWGGWVSAPLTQYFPNAEYIPYQWDLSEIEFLNGTYTRVFYQQQTDRLEVGTHTTSLYYTQESHPYKIVDRTGRYVEFELGDLSTKEYDLPPNKWHQNIFEKKYLKSVYLKHRDNTVLQRIDFGYDTGRVSGSSNVKRFLASVTSKSLTNDSLPATKLLYVGINGQASGENNGALKSVTTPTGGRIEFTYEFKTIPTQLKYVRDYTSVGSSPIESIEEVNESGTVGSNFTVVKLKNGNLEVFRWGVSGWYKDNTFPILTGVSSYKVSSDFVVVKTGTTNVKIVQLVDSEWRQYDVTANLDSVGISVNILGVSPSYVVIAHNKKIYSGTDSTHVLSLFKIENGNWKKTKTGPYKFSTTHPLKTRCMPNYFILEYLDMNSSAWVYEIYKYQNNQWSTSSNIPGYSKNVNTNYPITTGNDIFLEEYYSLKWNGSDFTPFSDQIGYATEGVHGENYFIIGYEYSINNSDYYVMSWRGDSTSTDPVGDITPFQSLRGIFYGVDGTLTSAKFATGSDFFVACWENSDTGKFAIVRYSNEIWRTNQIFSFFKKKITPYINGTDIIIALDSSTASYHTLKVFKQRDTLWFEEQEIQRLTGITSTNLVYTQTSNNIIADLVEKAYTDNQKTFTSFKKGYGRNNKITYSGDTAGVYVVSSVTRTDGMGGTLATKYVYANGLFSESGQSARFNKVTEYPPGNTGYITTYFYNDSIPSGADPFVNVPRYSRMDGMAYQTRIYDRDNSLLRTVTNYWKLHQIDTDSLVYHTRLDSVETTELSFTTKKVYEYEETNGAAKKITDANLKIQSDRGSNQGIVTEISFAHTAHCVGLNQNGKNILFRPFEKKVYEKSSNGTLALVSQERTLYSSTFPFYPTSSRVYAGTSWLITDSTVSRNSYGYVTESLNIDSVRSVTKWGNSSQSAIASFVNASNSETAFEPCEEFRSVSSYGSLANGFTEYNTQGYSNIYFKSASGVSGSCQKAVLPYSPMWRTGLYVNMGTLDAAVNYIIEFDYLVTQGGVEVFTHNGSTSSSQAIYLKEPSPRWKHAKILWNLGGVASSWKVYVRNPWDGEEAFMPSTFYLDNVRIYPVDAFCTSQTFDPVTLNRLGVTNENGVTSVTEYDTFGRAIHVKR